jgi:uncharacterized membrane protein YsdA (DUF1294 family)
MSPLRVLALPNLCGRIFLSFSNQLVIRSPTSFAVFGLDKTLAEARGWRISEAKLLGLALIGGSPGAYAGRHLFRHKTRKQPFSGELHTIAIIQVGVAAGVATWVLTG